MAKATLTLKARIQIRSQQDTWFATNHVLFNQVVAFYFEVIQVHERVLDLPTKEALTALETLTHTTADNPYPAMPLSALRADIPAMFRRAAINAALGSAKSFYARLKKWRICKEQAQAKGKTWRERPPIPPRAWNMSMPFYAGQWKDRGKSSIMLKVWTGSCWSWVKVHLNGRACPDGYEMGSPQLVHKGQTWWLHTPVEKTFTSPQKIAEQITKSPHIRICAVDLNLGEHVAVATIQTGEGTTLATRFIGGGRRVSGFRKHLLGRIARKRSQTGIIAVGEQDNAALWQKIRHIDDYTAHLVSARIVQFAQKHEATVLVFEHLGNLKPTKGKYSHRGNMERAYWMKGRIFQYAKYKAWNTKILTTRINPRNTSRECARCHALVIRYQEGQPQEGYTSGAPLVLCSECQMRGHADRNGSLVIGQRLINRVQKTHQEKPPAPRRAEREEQSSGGGVRQDVEGGQRPSISSPRHASTTGQGTAPEECAWMETHFSSIPTQLRLFNEAQPRCTSSESRLRRSGRSHRVSSRV